MYKGKTVAVVVPAYNEEGLVGSVIETVPSFVDRVYVVDDASTDGTWEEIQQHAQVTNNRISRPLSPAPDGGAAFEPRVVTIRHERNRGVGGAIKTGYRRALADGVEAVAVMNGDGQMDPAVLDRILDPVVEGEADYAKGNRLGQPADWRSMSNWRLFGNVLLTALTRIASGHWRMTDPQNGYTAISRRALETLDLDAVHDRYGFCNDVLVRLNVAGLEVADVPMAAVYGDEESHIRYSTFVPLLSWLLLRDFLWRLRATYGVAHPITGMYAFGAAGSAFGALAVTSHLGRVLLDAVPLEALPAGADRLVSEGMSEWLGVPLAVEPPPLLGGWLADATVATITLAFGVVLLSAAMALDRNANAARGVES